MSRCMVSRRMVSCRMVSPLPAARRSLRNLLIGNLAIAAAALAGCSSGPAPLPDLPEIASPVGGKVLWQLDIGRSVDFVLVPAVAGDALFAAAHDGTVVRVDPKTGRDVWRVDAGGKISAGVGASADLVVVGTLDGRVIALTASGKPLWAVRVSSEVSGPPLIARNLVVVRTVDNRVFGLNPADGKRRWVYQRAAPALMVRTSAGAVADQNHVYAGFPGGKLVALMASNGGLRWEGTVSLPKGTTELERVSDVVGEPWLAEREVCAVSFQGRAACFDSNTGAGLWTKEVSSTASLTGDGRVVFVSEAKGAVAALNRSTGANVWRQDKLTRRALSAPLPLGRFVALGDGQGFVHLLNRETGELIGRVTTDGSPISASPRRIESGFVVQTRGGTLYAIGV